MDVRSTPLYVASVDGREAVVTAGADKVKLLVVVVVAGASKEAALTYGFTSLYKVSVYGYEAGHSAVCGECVRVRGIGGGWGRTRRRW